jgi:hypothetical protein
MTKATHRFSLEGDMELAAETRAAGRVCGRALHSAHYEREARGVPEFPEAFCER